MVECLLVGMVGGGGEEVFVRDLAAHPPEGVRYTAVHRHHESAPGARALTLREVAFNRLVQPLVHPMLGLKAYRVDGRWDLVHVHNFPHKIRSRNGVPVVLSVGGGGYAHYLRHYLGWEEARVRRVLGRARRIYEMAGIASEISCWDRLQGIMVRSGFARARLLEGGAPPEKVRVVTPGVPDPLDDGALGGGPPDGPFTFLLLGRDPRRKGADLALEASRRLQEGGRSHRLLLVGDPWYEAGDFPDHVEGRGPVSREVVFREVLPRAHALLLPARAEGFGFVVVEALAFGIPPVVSDHGALPEIVAGGEAGMIVAPEDVEALAGAMQALLEDGDELERLGRAARARYREVYTREAFQERLDRFYRRALEA